MPRPPAPLHRALLPMLILVAPLTNPLHAQRLTATDPNAEPVTVESATISTEVTGRIAVTTFDLVFRNPNNRVLEGVFEFPLLDGQSVVRFGLDINGRLREAVPVEKNRGRVVFEEIERRRVDPGLLEQTAGNNYRARVFPIPVRGTRRVVIAYQEDLVRGAGDPVYRLALDFPQPLKTFRLDVNVQTADATLAKATTTLPFELPAWQSAKRLAVERTQFTARGVFALELPRAERPRVLTEHRGANDYFYAEVPVAAVEPVGRPIPQVVGLLWDASGSGRQRDHARELALLDAWFAAVPDVDVRLIVFRDQTAAPTRFRVAKGDWSKLRAELEKVVYDGATSLDGLTDDPAVGEWLLFSDGLLNYGGSQTAAVLPLRAPVHTVLASPLANPAFLRGVAQRQAGEFVNLLTATPVAAARVLRSESLRVLALEHDPEQVAQVFPSINAPVDQGTLVVTGILKTPSSTVRVRLGHNASDAREVELPVRSGENPSGLAARAWAVTKIASLEPDLAANREDIRRTSQEFGIVTGDTSLIVLETLEDYVRYDIAPPEELRAAWEAHRQTSADIREKNRDAQLARIARLFEEKTQWWKTKFTSLQSPAPAAEASSPNGAVSGRQVAPPPVVARSETPPPVVAGSETPPPNRLVPAPVIPNPTSTAPVPTTPSPASNAPAPATPSNAPAPQTSAPALADEVVTLSPFVVESSRDNSYRATSTLAGTRVRTDLRDVASSMSTVTEQFLQDTGAANNRDLLTHTPSTEVAGVRGNFPGEARARADENVAVASTPGPGPRASAAAPGAGAITLRHWEAQAGYLDRLHRAAAEERYSIYLEERSDHLNQPGFFLDVADFFFEAKDPATALRILSNLAELQLDDPALLRVLAHRLVQAARPELARPLFERVLVLRPEEPQSRRDLALVCAALKQYQRAIDLLWEVVERPTDARFPEIELIALGELNSIIATCGEKLDLSRIDPRFRQNLPVGLRVVLTWDTDACDIDLWVDDPTGERAIYSHPSTAQGGRMSRDFTAGYGPEEFLLRDPAPGKYTVRINYFGDRRQTTLGPVTAQIRLITGFGTPAEKEQRLTLRLSESKETLEVGTIQIGG